MSSVQSCTTWNRVVCIATCVQFIENRKNLLQRRLNFKHICQLANCMTKVVYICSSRLQLTVGSRDLSLTVWPEPIWKKVNTSTTTASKYIPKRPRNRLNWNPPFRSHFNFFFKNCFLLSKTCFTMFTFRGTFTK